MSSTILTTIEDQYLEAFADSRRLHDRARGAIVGGITHDGRYLEPFPPYIASAQGSHKTSVDGHDLIDYAVGHGSLIFGHNDPDLTTAMQEQVARGTHLGAGHEGEVRWAEKIVELVPSAERVRFTASGTEATLLGMRVARGVTGKTVILKFEGHFHGWQDYALKGEKPPFENVSVPGIPQETLGTVSVLPANDLAMLEERLVQGDVAGIIIEPSGASWATIPLKPDFLKGVRALADAHGTVLIFDEVITGFRWAPGGAQERFGVTPDITTLAKIVAGGMPGGAVAGRADVMDIIAFKSEPGWNQKRRVPQAGTYNANPLAAAAGYTCLSKLSDRSIHDHCDRLAADLRAGMNRVLRRHGTTGFAWGESSVFHVALEHALADPADGDLHTPEGMDPEYLKKSGGTPLAQKLEVGMLLEGAHLFHAGGFTSKAHTDDDIAFTVNAFDTVVGRLVAEGAMTAG